MLRMVEVGDRLGLVAEPPRVVLARTRAVADHLEGDQAVQAPLPSPVHHPHPAPRDLAQQLVVAEFQPRVSRRRRLRPTCRQSRSGRIRFAPIRGRLGPRPPSLAARERGQAMELVLDGEEISELRGELGMAIEQDPAIQIRHPVLGGLVVGGEHLRGARLFATAVRRSESSVMRDD